SGGRTHLGGRGSYSLDPLGGLYHLGVELGIVVVQPPPGLGRHGEHVNEDIDDGPQPHLGVVRAGPNVVTLAARCCRAVVVLPVAHGRHATPRFVSTALWVSSQASMTPRRKSAW